MRKTILGALALCFGLTTSTIATAATYDMTGLWDYTTSGEVVAGPCPTIGDRTGQLVINQDGDTFALHLISGSVCVPSDGCFFHGGITGAVYAGGNSYPDGSGGQVANTVDYTASSADAAAGTGGSVWTGEGGQCTWTYTIVMTRAVIPDAGVDLPDVTPPLGEDGGVDAGPGLDAGAELDAASLPDVIALFDVSMFIDVTTAPDTSTAPDASAAPDSSAAPDAAIAVDAAQDDSASPSADAATGSDAASSTGDSGSAGGDGDDDDDDDDEGCGCRATRGVDIGPLGLLLGLLLWRRRR